MDIQEVYNLLERFEKSTIAELELEMSGTRVVMKKRELGSAQPDGTGLNGQTAQAVQTRQPQAPVSSLQSDKALVAKRTEIKAPLVGTFYRAPSPDDKPYVMVGQKVKKGDVVGIIEAMKLMNEIVAPMDGVVETIDVENGAMVEYHQVLMTLGEE